MLHAADCNVGDDGAEIDMCLRSSHDTPLRLG